MSLSGSGFYHVSLNRQSRSLLLSGLLLRIGHGSLYSIA